jgi:hypothetical protein
MRRLVALCIVAMCALLTGTAAAQEYPVYTVPDVIDAWITVHPAWGGPNTPHVLAGGLEEVGCNGFQAFPLIQFDLSGFRGHTVVGTPTLTLTVEGGWNTQYGYGGPWSQTVQALRVVKPWTNNQVTWNNFGPGPICVTPNWQGMVNVDCSPLDTVSMAVFVGDQVTWHIPASLLQQWIDYPQSNKGILLLSTTPYCCQDIAFASLKSTIYPGPELTFATSN